MPCSLLLNIIPNITPNFVCSYYLNVNIWYLILFSVKPFWYSPITWFLYICNPFWIIFAKTQLLVVHCSSIFFFIHTVKNSLHNLFCNLSPPLLIVLMNFNFLLHFYIFFDLFLLPLSLLGCFLFWIVFLYLFLYLWFHLFIFIKQVFKIICVAYLLFHSKLLFLYFGIPLPLISFVIFRILITFSYFLVYIILFFNFFSNCCPFFCLHICFTFLIWNNLINYLDAERRNIWIITKEKWKKCNL